MTVRETLAEYRLKGCTTKSVSDYLKALGLFKILSEKEPEVIGCWNDDVFVIKTRMKEEEIINFLIKEYRPTPIIAPWSYNKYKKYCKTIMALESKRFDSYKQVVKQVDRILDKTFPSNHPLKKEDVDKNKYVVLQQLRNMLPDNIVPWLDSVFVIESKKSKPTFAPVLGSGGNDGNFDMVENFIEKINYLLSKKEDGARQSQSWLEKALFDCAFELENMTTVGHNPDGCCGPNSGMGFSGRSLSNPWDYVLMIEGIMLFAGSISKRLSSTSVGKAAFPFTTYASNVGYATASAEDIDDGKEPASKGEIWLPVWNNFATYREIKHVFNEGRVLLGRKPAKTGVEFTRAMITLGVERGISKFQRFGILKRKGKAYLYVNMGDVHVKNEPAAGVLEELDKWYNSIIKKSKEKGAPASLKILVRNMDEAIMNYCTHVKKENLLRILIQVGKIERYTSGYEDYRPLQKLSEIWLNECDDGTPEFRLAASIGSINGGNISIRENLEGIVKEKNRDWKHKKDSISFVWKDNDSTLRNISRVLYRRGLDGKIKSLDAIPIDGKIHARKEDIDRFLNGDLDIKKIGDLVLPLSIICATELKSYPWKNKRDEMDEISMPEAYSIIKMIYSEHKKKDIPYDMSVLASLYAGNTDAAYSRAAYILHAHGVSLNPYSKKTGNKSTTISDVVKKHLCPSMLFPISCKDKDIILKSVTTQD